MDSADEASEINQHSRGAVTGRLSTRIQGPHRVEAEIKAETPGQQRARDQLAEDLRSNERRAAERINSRLEKMSSAGAT
jgi:hypothetical protein